MPINREQKEKIVEDLSARLKGAKGIIFTDYTGLTVTEVSKLRNELREIGATYNVIKKNLVGISLKNAGLSDKVDVDSFKGPVAVTIAEDGAAPAKVVSKFSKENEKLVLLSSLLDGESLSDEQFTQIANLPSRDELIALTVGQIGAPLSGFVGVLSGVMRGLVYALNAISESKR